MRKNECKKNVLSAVQDLKDPVPPCLVQTWLEMEYNVSLTDRAASMELLRLMRQGLLHRKDGKYQISPKGEQRLQWLRSTIQ